MRALLAALAACVAIHAGAAAPRSPGYAARPEVHAFIADMVEKYGFSREKLERLFSAARPQRSILRAMQAPAETTPRGWEAYKALFLTRERIDAGVRFQRANAEPLARAAQTYGVPESIIVAILGVETAYGRNTGNYRVIDALSTLAFDFPQRADFFRGELEQYLLYTREEGLEALDVKGSYAGAIGIPQFMPGTYRRYGVDFDGDGRRDLARSAADAVGSVANFLMEHGWQSAQPVAVRARVAGERYSPLLQVGVKPGIPVESLTEFGVAVSEPLPAGSLCTLIELPNPGKDPEYRVGLQNFYVLTRYNRSSLYALAVQELAGAIEAALSAPISPGPPPGFRPG